MSDIDSILSKIKRMKARPAGSDPVIAFGEYDQPEGIQGKCRIFIGCKRNGYGVVRFKGKAVYVHRYVWILAYGVIDKKMVIDHICRNRACCNIDHLRLVTRSVNVRENIVGANWQKMAAKTHCKYGHEFTPENTKIYRGKRLCVACRRNPPSRN